MSYGSSIVTVVAAAASRSAERARGLEGHVGGVDAVRLAVGEGDPQVDDRVAVADAALHLRAHALLDAGDELARHRRRRPPCRRTRSPEPSGSGSTSMSQTAYWPCPPDCLTCRPCALGLAGERLAQRHHERHLVDVDASSGSASRSRTTSACASPMHQSTSWWVSALFSTRSDGSSAASRLSACDSLSSSALLCGDDRDRQQRLGQRPRHQHPRVARPRRGCRRSRRG